MDDQDIAIALGRRADELAPDLDTDSAWERVARRGGARRRWRAAVTAVGTAAAAVVVVVVMITVAGGGRETVRAPATQVVVPTTAPSSPPAPTEALTTPTTVPSAPGPTSTPVMPATTLETTAGQTTSPPVATTAPPVIAPPASTSTYNANGGAITVRLTGSQIALASDPVPTSGWSGRIDDNGPDRVRVRFEMGDQRSEIRVDLVDGQLVPRITEG